VEPCECDVDEDTRGQEETDEEEPDPDSDEPLETDTRDDLLRDAGVSPDSGPEGDPSGGRE
jgi:hypothetical protein